MYLNVVRSYSPASRRLDYSASPGRRLADRLRSPGGPPPARNGDHIRRSYSPGYGVDEKCHGYSEQVFSLFYHFKILLFLPFSAVDSKSGRVYLYYTIIKI
ncbi:hypothetical protein MANES_07G116804v8 [Manihot esculenta]|uniref:Uncharacterized protein n=1 Tax=Manihot esculenta TaxID=3983 RepID=A0ACB7HH72_MANES|nr:hypothetical protein MANES_07G116804v8 [Manihot esculenta]